ncbi:PRC-barrel domain-containing protein [Croceicoccus bisphenolivorans]|uniref:PRC-barrel domain-containing protein n=1 Tax=Croceicoccus bisphenolivorans TaxID=1783232 RepID=UPI000835579D|nr:PRC-barrel domain-containing protein [Croceicoccus bisphenolivorans]
MAHDHKLILASRVENTSVFNEDGWLIGHIRDLSIDRESGQVVHAIMSFGGFLGIGNRLHPLPWSMLGYNAERHGYIVSLDKAALEQAPHYDADELEDFGGAHHDKKRSDVLEYYGRYGPPPI